MRNHRDIRVTASEVVVHEGPCLPMACCRRTGRSPGAHVRLSNCQGSVSGYVRHFATGRVRPRLLLALVSTAAMHPPLPLRVKGTHYRAAALLPAFPRTADMCFEKMAA